MKSRKLSPDIANGTNDELKRLLPLVSVIVPVYKVESYLRKCIDSIIAQTYTNLEIILIDDGSPDNCPAICDEYATNDYRVQVIHKENGGLSDARNVGISIAKGDWICFVDSDDIVNINYVRILVTAAIKNDCEIAICSYSTFYNDKTINIHKKIYKTNCLKIISPIEAFKKQYVSDVTKYVVAWNKIYKRSLFDTKIRFPIGRLHEDDFTTYKLFLEANKIVDIDYCLNYYRVRKESITANYSPKRIQDYIEAHEESLEYIRRYNDKNFLVEALYVLFLAYLKLYGTSLYKEDKVTEIVKELTFLRKSLSLKRRIKFAYKRNLFNF